MRKPDHPFDDLNRGFNKVWNSLAQDVSIMASQEFQENFYRGGYQDLTGSFHPWKARQLNVGAKRAMLIGRGRLVRSIKPVPTKGIARVVASEPYAAIHQKGGEIKITPKMRKFFWAMHYKYRKRKARRVKDSLAPKRKENSIAAYWKALALKKGSIIIPARPYMVTSKRIVDNVNDHVFDKLNKLFYYGRT